MRNNKHSSTVTHEMLASMSMSAIKMPYKSAILTPCGNRQPDWAAPYPALGWDRLQRNPGQGYWFPLILYQAAAAWMGSLRFGAPILAVQIWAAWIRTRPPGMGIRIGPKCWILALPPTWLVCPWALPASPPPCLLPPAHLPPSPCPSPVLPEPQHHLSSAGLTLVLPLDPLPPTSSPLPFCALLSS